MLEKDIPTVGRVSSSPRSIKDPEVKDTIKRTTPNATTLYPSPVAWEDQQLYFLLPDRFSNEDEDGTLDTGGQPVRGPIRAYIPSDNGNAIRPPNDPKTWEDNGIIFQGGTLKGIKSKLGYLKRLGVTAVWVGPIFKQVPTDKHSYHGYAIQDFLEIDPHFGTREDLKDLVKSAHDEGIYFILDIILNHSGDVFAYKGGDKQWNGQRFPVEGYRDSTGRPLLPFRPIDLINPPKNQEDCAIWPSELQSPATFTQEGAISNWENWPEYIRGDFLSLKDIDLGPDNPDSFAPTPALRTLCEVYKYWIAFADLDGYRIDTVKHMGDGPTRYLCTTLHEYASSIGKDNFFLVGEVTGGHAYETVELTGLNAALGVGNIQEKLWKLPKGKANPSDYFDLFRNATYLKKESNAWMRNKLVTMIDDHDQVWRGGETPRYSRFCDEDEGEKLVLAALALNLTTLGIPCIYYGTEQRFDGEGGSDQYIHEAMFSDSFNTFQSKDCHFFDESNTVFREVSKICTLRRKYATLRRGRQYLREISADGKGFGIPHIIGDRMKSIVAWSRIFADQEILCAINTDTVSWTEAFVTIDSDLHDEGSSLSRIYMSPFEGSSHAIETARVESLNGKAIKIAIPPSGFVVYL
jgi:glycosidase